MKKLFVLMMVFLLVIGCSAKKGEPVADYNTYNEEEKYIESTGYGEGYTVSDAETSYNGHSQNDEKLVYTSKIVLETKTYDDLLKEVSQLVSQYEGFNEYIHENGGDYRSTNLTVRIPSASFDAFINDLRNGSGSVADITINVDNITKTYNDALLRIETLNTQHARLLELLAKAKDLTDIIELETRLSEVEYQLESYNNALNEMDSKVAYSTISITIREVVVYSEVKISFFQRLADAFKGSWNSFVRNFEDFTVDLIYALPGLAITAALFFLLRKPVGRIFNSKGISLPSLKKNKKETEDNTETK